MYEELFLCIILYSFDDDDDYEHGYCRTALLLALAVVYIVSLHYFLHLLSFTLYHCIIHICLSEPIYHHYIP